MLVSVEIDILDWLVSRDHSSDCTSEASFGRPISSSNDLLIVRSRDDLVLVVTWRRNECTVSTVHCTLTVVYCTVRHDGSCRLEAMVLRASAFDISLFSLFKLLVG